MQSESDSDNEFFDASEKLSLSGSFTSDLRCVPVVSVALVPQVPRMNVVGVIFIFFSSLMLLLYMLPFSKFQLNDRIFR